MDDGLRINPASFADQGLADLIVEMNRRPATTDVEAMRAGGAARAQTRAPGPELPEVIDLTVPARQGAPAVAVRWYRPTLGPVSLVVYAHGGGWTIGSIDTHDRICRRLAKTSGVGVVSVNYRLAPEHPAPAAVEDVVTVLEWVDTTPAQLGELSGRVAVAGDSAGGTLAALACVRLRDDRARSLPDLQVMVYANTDLTGPGASMREKAAGWGLDVTLVEHFNDQWVPDRNRWANPDVSPLWVEDLGGLPPALVVTAEHDPLRDQGEAYAARLRAAGVPVEVRREGELVHNFLMYDLASPACAAAGDRLGHDIGRLLEA